MGGVFMKSLFDGPWVRVGTNATAKAAPGAQVGKENKWSWPAHQTCVTYDAAGRASDPAAEVGHGQ